jgi:hypothetical protein
MPLDPQNEAIKDALKEGLREWLDDQFAEFGKWTMRAAMAAALAGVVWLALISSGWKHP